MGNQLSTPARWSAEQALSEVPDLVFKDKLPGGSKFMKTCLCMHHEWSRRIVVKVFSKQRVSQAGDKVLVRTEELRQYHDRLQHLRDVLASPGVVHALPYEQWVERDLHAYVIRAHLNSNLRDLMHSSHYLSPAEKWWMVFQLLVALEEVHDRGVCHGDLKPSNVLLLSWHWLFLADFSGPFKPALLSDTPGEFEFYFDSDGDHEACYVAPERFFHEGEEPSQQAGSGEARSLQPSMDIFSLGCLIAELFSPGNRPLFDFSKLISYKRGEAVPDLEAKLSGEPKALALVQHMTQLDPRRRASASWYLREWPGEQLFPPEYAAVLHPLFLSILHMDLDSQLAELRARFAGLIQVLVPAPEASDSFWTSGEFRMLVPPFSASGAAGAVAAAAAAGGVSEGSREDASGQHDVSAIELPLLAGVSAGAAAGAASAARVAQQARGVLQQLGSVRLESLTEAPEEAAADAQLPSPPPPPPPPQQQQQQGQEEHVPGPLRSEDACGLPEADAFAAGPTASVPDAAFALDDDPCVSEPLEEVAAPPPPPAEAAAEEHGTEAPAGAEASADSMPDTEPTEPPPAATADAAAGPAGSGSGGAAPAAAEVSPGLVLVALLLCSLLQGVKLQESCWAAIGMLHQLGRWCSTEVLLQLILPYLLSVVSDPDTPSDRDAPLRAFALRSVVSLLGRIQHSSQLSQLDKKLLQDYVLPALSLLPGHPEELVRVEYARQLPGLATKALRFQMDLEAQLLSDPAGAGRGRGRGSPRAASALEAPGGAARPEGEAAAAAAAGPSSQQVQQVAMERANLLWKVKQSVDLILDGLLDQDGQHRGRWGGVALLHQAAVLAAFFGPKEATNQLVPRLIPLLNQPDWGVGRALLSSLPELAQRLEPHTWRQTLLPCLLPHLSMSHGHNASLLSEVLAALTQVVLAERTSPGEEVGEAALVSRRQLIQLAKLVLAVPDGEHTTAAAQPPESSCLLMHRSVSVRARLVSFISALLSRLSPADICAHVQPLVDGVVHCDALLLCLPSISAAALQPQPPPQPELRFPRSPLQQLLPRQLAPVLLVPPAAAASAARQLLPASRWDAVPGGSAAPDRWPLSAASLGAGAAPPPPLPPQPYFLEPDAAAPYSVQYNAVATDFRVSALEEATVAVAVPMLQSSPSHPLRVPAAASAQWLYQRAVAEALLRSNLALSSKAATLRNLLELVELQHAPPCVPAAAPPSGIRPATSWTASSASQPPQARPAPSTAAASDAPPPSAAAAAAAQPLPVPVQGDAASLPAVEAAVLSMPDALTALLASQSAQLAGRQAPMDAGGEADLAGSLGRVHGAEPPVNTAAVRESIASAVSTVMAGHSPDEPEPPPPWEPQGTLVAHLAEHSAGVNCLALSPAAPLLLSASSDGTCKVWDIGRLQKMPSFQSRLTYSGHRRAAAPGSRVLSCCWLGDGASCASACSSGGIHIWQLDGASAAMDPAHTAGPFAAMQVVHSTEIHPEQGAVQQLLPWGPLLLYLSQRAGVHALDPRCRREAWLLRCSPQEGLLRRMVASSQDLTWLATGSSRGCISLWDVRFHLRANSWRFQPAGGPAPPADEPIMDMALASAPPRLLGLRDYTSSAPLVYVAAGRKEVSLWDLEEGRCRQRLLLSGHSQGSGSASAPVSPAEGPGSSDRGAPRAGDDVAFWKLQLGGPQLAQTPAACVGVRCLLPQDDGRLLTGSTDRIIRCWSAQTPPLSYVVCCPPPELAQLQGGSDTPADGGTDAFTRSSHIGTSDALFQDNSNRANDKGMPYTWKYSHKQLGVESRVKEELLVGNDAVAYAASQPHPAAQHSRCLRQGTHRSTLIGLGRAQEEARAHQDCVTQLLAADLGSGHPSDRLLISASRDGIVKAWR